MKKFLHKKWLSIPVIVVLVLALTAGSVLAAAYNFWSGAVTADVVEAIAIGAGTWDNLAPYGLNENSLDDVDIAFGEDTITITTAGSGDVVGDGFCPGEWIVIPLNIRNGSDGDLALAAEIGENLGGFILEACFELNTGVETEPIPEGHEGAYLSYGFKATGTFEDLASWSETVVGNSGFSGSAVHDAQVLFVKISAPGEMPPGVYTCTIGLTRESPLAP